MSDAVETGIGNKGLRARLAETRVQCALLIALPFLLYCTSISYRLINFDDGLYYANPDLHGGALAGLRGAFTTTILSDYAPVAQLTMWLDLALFGSNSFAGARIHGLLWFVLGCLGVRALGAQLTGKSETGFAAGLLYAVHPVCAVSVLWLAERKNLVAFALAIWSIERYVAAAAGKSSRPMAALIGSVLLFVLALLAKPHALAVAAAVVAYEVLLGDRAANATRSQGWRRVLRSIVFIAVAVLYTGVSMLKRTDLNRQFLGGSRLAAFVSDGPILLRYLAHTVCPRGLALYYYAVDLPSNSALGWSCWLGVGAIVAATCWLARDRKLVLFCWSLALAGLAPAFNLVPQLAPMADHYLQWALPGLLLVVVVTVSEALNRIPAVPLWTPGAALCAGVLAFGVLALPRLDEFRDRGTLFATNAANQPDTAFGWTGYARRLIVEHDAAAGMAAVRAVECGDAYRLLPEDRYVMTKEALSALARAGQPARAEQILNAQGPLIGPALTKVILAETAVRTGHAAEALTLLEPPSDAVVAALAAVRKECRSGARLPDELPPQLQLTAPKYNEAGELDFSTIELVVEPLKIRALAYLTQNDVERAFDHAALAVHAAPQDSGTRALLAVIYQKLQLPQAAEALLQHRPAVAAPVMR